MITIQHPDGTVRYYSERGDRVFPKGDRPAPDIVLTAEVSQAEYVRRANEAWKMAEGGMKAALAEAWDEGYRQARLDVNMPGDFLSKNPYR